MARLVMTSAQQAPTVVHLPPAGGLLTIEGDGKPVLAPTVALEMAVASLGVVIPWSTGGQVFHCLVTPPSQRVWRNGCPTLGGCLVLEDQDTIQLPGIAFLYDRFSWPEAQPYAGPPDMPCAWCRDRLVGTVMVCPQCGLTYHHAHDSCWTAAGHCRCGQPTASYSDTEPASVGTVTRSEPR